MGKDSSARIELIPPDGNRWESDFVPLWDGTIMRRLNAERKLLEGT